MSKSIERKYLDPIKMFVSVCIESVKYLDWQSQMIIFGYFWHFWGSLGNNEKIGFWLKPTHHNQICETPSLYMCVNAKQNYLSMVVSIWQVFGLSEYQAMGNLLSFNCQFFCYIKYRWR